jgi:hypothetical protein
LRQSTSRFVPKDPVIERHRREMFRQAYLPMALVAGVMGIALIFMVLSMSSFQVGTVSAFMSLLILVPMTLACIIPYVLVVAMAIGVKKLNVALLRPFAYLRRAVHQANNQSYEVSRKVAAPVIWVNTRVAWLESVITEQQDRFSRSRVNNSTYPKALRSGSNVDNEK